MPWSVARTISLPAPAPADVTLQRLAAAVQTENRTTVPDTLVGTVSRDRVFVKLTGSGDMNLVPTFDGALSADGRALTGTVRMAENTALRVVAVDVGVFFILGASYLFWLSRGGGRLGPLQWASVALLVPAIVVLAACLEWWLGRRRRATLVARLSAALSQTIT